MTKAEWAFAGSNLSFLFGYLRATGARSLIKLGSNRKSPVGADEPIPFRKKRYFFAQARF
jgi:hypothetical protein